MKSLAIRFFKRFLFFLKFENIWKGAFKKDGAECNSNTCSCDGIFYCVKVEFFNPTVRIAIKHELTLSVCLSEKVDTSNPLSIKAKFKFNYSIFSYLRGIRSGQIIIVSLIECTFSSRMTFNGYWIINSFLCKNREVPKPMWMDW